MRRHNVSEERIILMMYDDIAYNKLNPNKGIIINKPGGPNVYTGVKIDYKGKDVNPETFVNVLLGNETGLQGVGSGKVLKSGPLDHVFVNFVDHGGPGLIAFGMNFLKASKLHETIWKMHDKKSYAKMVFYVEACESGSMFDHWFLHDILNVYAMTAATAHQPSYACYHDKHLNTFLGDVYSVKWMEDADKEDLDRETIKMQYEIVRSEVNTSHVEEYGLKKINEMTVAEFMGKSKEARIFDAGDHKDPNEDAVKSDDVELSILQHRFSEATDDQEKRDIEKALAALNLARDKVREVFKAIVTQTVIYKETVDWVLHSKLNLVNLQCYEPLVDQLQRECPGIHLVKTGYALRHLYLLVNMCEGGYKLQTISDAIAAIGTRQDLCH